MGRTPTACGALSRGSPAHHAAPATSRPPPPSRPTPWPCRARRPRPRPAPRAGRPVGTALAYAGGVSLYAAYGPNMDPAQMKERCPHSPMSGTGWLRGWRLTFGGEDYGPEGALSTVVEDETSQVFVVLYDVPEQDVATLDRWE